MVSFFSDDGGPFRQVLQELAPDHWKAVEKCAQGTPEFEVEMMRLVLASTVSTPGDDVYRTEAIRYLKAHFLALPPERQEEVRSQPGAGLLIDKVLSTPDLDSTGGAT